MITTPKQIYGQYEALIFCAGILPKKMALGIYNAMDFFKNLFESSIAYCFVTERSIL